MKVACLQFTSGAKWTDHRATVGDLIAQAASTGARLIATPENTGPMIPDKEQLVREAHLEQDHPAVIDFSAWAKKSGAYLLCGSLMIKAEPGDALPRNRSLLFAPDGKIVARYDKCHLFNATFENGHTYRESSYVAAGCEQVIAHVEEATLGLSVCYDVRFPGLYRHMALDGAQILCVPAAFVIETGAAHWEVLLRARAIETGSYVIAPAQTGTHAGGRQTYGHSLIINPWGEVMQDGGTGIGFITADLDLRRVDEVRRLLGSLRP